MKKLFKKLKSKKGFTLVESVLAIAVLSIASMTFAIFLASSNKMTLATIKQEEDFAILQEAMSTIKINDTETTGTITIDGKVLNGKVIKKVTGTDKDVSFTLDFSEYYPESIDKSETTFEVKGKYVYVENPKNGQHFMVFVPNEPDKTK